MAERRVVLARPPGVLQQSDQRPRASSNAALQEASSPAASAACARSIAADRGLT
jgi:hypothetical protein